VRPKMLLSVSGTSMSCGTFPRHNMTAPASRSICTCTESAAAGWKQRAAHPAVQSYLVSMAVCTTAPRTASAPVTTKQRAGGWAGVCVCVCGRGKGGLRGALQRVCWNAAATRGSGYPISKRWRTHSTLYHAEDHVVQRPRSY
jgi:hypothetical protein